MAMPGKESDEIKTQPAVSSNTMEDSDDLGLGGSCLKSSGLGANTSSTKVNAFSRLMAPKGKTTTTTAATVRVGLVLVLIRHLYV